MKAAHAQLDQPDLVSVFVGTWNMGERVFVRRKVTSAELVFNCVIDWLLFAGGSPPPRSLQSWVTCCGLGHTPDDSTALLPHDIYALGTQENPQGEKEWTEHVKATLRSCTQLDFKLVIIFSSSLCQLGWLGLFEFERVHR